MTTKEALELAISELELNAYECTDNSEYNQLREALQKLEELLETM
jgi:hypothetical protein